MKKSNCIFHRELNGQKGATMIEAAIIIACICLVVAVGDGNNDSALTRVSNGINNTFCSTAGHGFDGYQSTRFDLVLKRCVSSSTGRFGSFA